MEANEAIKVFLISLLKRYIYEMDFFNAVLVHNDPDDLDIDFIRNSIELARGEFEDILSLNFEKEFVERIPMYGTEVVVTETNNEPAGTPES